MKKVIEFGLVGVLNTIIHYGLFIKDCRILYKLSYNIPDKLYCEQ